MEVPCNLPPPPQETGDRVLGATNPLPPSPPPSGQPGQGPTTPLHYSPSLGPAAVKTSLRPPNPDQKSQF
jgi:hypothetical protein